VRLGTWSLEEKVKNQLAQTQFASARTSNASEVLKARPLAQQGAYHQSKLIRPSFPETWAIDKPLCFLYLPSEHCSYFAYETPFESPLNRSLRGHCPVTAKVCTRTPAV